MAFIVVFTIQLEQVRRTLETLFLKLLSPQEHLQFLFSVFRKQDFVSALEPNNNSALKYGFEPRKQNVQQLTFFLFFFDSTSGN